MTDEFLTMGLQNDRYLKALRLVNQFENEIGAILRECGQRMIEQHPDLFDRTTDSSMRISQNPSSALATQRINYPMNGPRAPDSGQRLNIHLYWMHPTEYDRTDIEGALRAFGYKIKDADQDTDAWVVEQTRVGDWSLETSPNPFDSNIVFYRHVGSIEEIEETTKTLVEHFSTFGDEYSVDSDEK